MVCRRREPCRRHVCACDVSISSHSAPTRKVATRIIVIWRDHRWRTGICASNVPSTRPAMRQHRKPPGSVTTPRGCQSNKVRSSIQDTTSLQQVRLVDHPAVEIDDAGVRCPDKSSYNTPGPLDLGGTGPEGRVDG